ncbi:hypothetical protein CN103_32160, partial [Sinorhizobium meliloti]
MAFLVEFRYRFGVEEPAGGDRVLAHGGAHIIEFAAKLPPEMKLRGLVEKHILREATKDL